MRSKQLLLFSLIVVAALLGLAACGPSGPKTDIDINARILDIRPEERVIRISDLGAGRHYELRVREDAEILKGAEKLGFDDLQKGLQVRVWANQVSGEIKYEIVKLLVTDSGEGAPLRR